MPNHVLNRLIIKADKNKTQEVFHFMTGKTLQDGTCQYIDFNKIIPIPVEVTVNEIIINNKKYYDYSNCNEWCRNNWGSKWNAFKQKLETLNILWFTTADIGVPFIIEKLSRIFPDIEFEYTFADEHWGCTTGDGIFRNGETDITFPTNGSDKAYEIYFKVNPGMKNYFLFTEEGYEWIGQTLSTGML